MGDFEKDLRNAFEGAEFTPSPQVWDGVKAGLAPKKKGGIFYMWQTYGVAATILFLLTMGFLFRDELFTTGGTEAPQTEIAKTSETDREKENPENATANSAAKVDSADVNALKEDIQSTKSLIQNRQLQAKDAKTFNIKDLTESTQESNNRTQIVAALPTTVQENPGFEEPVLTQLQANSNSLAVSEASITMLSPQELQESIAALRLRWELQNMVGALEIDTTHVVESVETLTVSRTSLSGSFGGGNFNPNTGGSTELALQENIVNDPLAGDFRLSSSSDESEKQLGSLSIGGGIGFEIGRRWILKTGLRYSQYRYATNSNAYSEEDGRVLPVYNNASALTSASQLRYAGEYELTNTIHSISVPVQMGYKLLDRDRFGVVLNAGLGADYFAKYTVKGELSFLDTRKVDLGETDLLNRFNVNVLTGLELNYKLNEKFALSGEVFFRQYIPSLGETTGVASTTPSFFGFGLGLNYYLKRKN